MLLSQKSFLRCAISCAALASFLTPSNALGRGPLQKIVMQGDIAPGADGRRFSVFSRVLFDRAGTLAVYSYLSDSGGSPGIWTYRDAGGLQLAVRHGDVAPGHDGGPAGTFDFSGGLSGSSFKLNAHGDVAFYSRLGSNIDRAHDEGIWVAARGGGLRMVAQKGDVAPGTNGEVFRSVAPFNYLDYVEIN